VVPLIRTTSPSRTTCSSRAPWTIAMPIRAKLAATSAATSASSKPRMRWPRSKIVTSVWPRLANTVAYSQPTTPAPITASRRGSAGSRSM
jgi:hypothetical protein